MITRSTELSKGCIRKENRLLIGKSCGTNKYYCEDCKDKAYERTITLREIQEVNSNYHDDYNSGLNSYIKSELEILQKHFGDFP